MSRFCPLLVLALTVLAAEASSAQSIKSSNASWRQSSSKPRTPKTEGAWFEKLRQFWESEATQEFIRLVSDEPLGIGKGWYRPSQSRYSWSWLAQRIDANKDGAITAIEFRGPPEWFRVLDRNGDGRITAADIDWALEVDPSNKLCTDAWRLFRAIDADGDDMVSPEEWQAFMRNLTNGRKYLVADDLIPALVNNRARPAASKANGRWGRSRMIQAFLSGEMGSFHEGPRLEGRAPDFKLQSPDGKRTVTLSDYAGKKPVVLIFGSFT